MARPTSRSHSRGSKRAAEDTSDNKEPAPKRGFLGRTLSRAINAVNFSTGGRELESNEESSQPPDQPDQGTTLGGNFQSAKPDWGPVPTDPVEKARYVANYVDFKAGQRTAAKEEADFLSPNQKFRFNMNITPHDKAWVDTRQKFIRRLKEPDISIMDVFEKYFDAAQRLFLEPQESGGLISQIQKEHTEEYKSALSSRFRSVPDNLPTKMTMLHFGLPIEPVTHNNYASCRRVDDKGKDIDVSDEPDDFDAPNYDIALHSERPLEFLNRYGDGRSYDIPKLRIAKRKDTLQFPDTVPFTTGVNDSSEAGELGGGKVQQGAGSFYAVEPPISMRGGAGKPEYTCTASPLILRGGHGPTSPKSTAASAKKTLLSPNTAKHTEPDDEEDPVPPPARASPRENKERFLAGSAGKRKEQAYSTWIAEQHHQDKFRHISHNQDQSVVEPGRLPVPPLFGPTRELQLEVGSSMPTVFAQHITPTDIRKLQEENQKLRNQALERTLACQICDVEFEAFQKDEIRKHVRQHQEQLKESGECPICADPQWAFFTRSEKRFHFDTHQKQNEEEIMKDLVGFKECLVCADDLTKLKPNKVIRHCLAHAYDAVQDQLECPLLKENGEECDYKIGVGMEDDGVDLIQHYIHRPKKGKEGASEADTELYGYFSDVRYMMKRGTPETNASFISQRSALLAPSPVAPAPSEPVPSNANLAVPPLASPSPAKAPPRTPPQTFVSPAAEKLPKVSPPKTTSSNLRSPGREPTKADLARRVRAQAAEARASAARAAATQTSTAPRPRRASVGKQAYKDLAEASETDLESLEEIEELPESKNKRKGGGHRPRSGPTKAAPTGRKRKHAEEEQEEFESEVKKGKKGKKAASAAPAQKKQKLNDDAEVKSPKKAGRPKKSKGVS